MEVPTWDDSERREKKSRAQTDPETVAIPMLPTVCNFAKMFKVGDIFTRAGCYSIDPVTLAPTKELIRFRVMSVETNRIEGKAECAAPSGRLKGKKLR